MSKRLTSFVLLVVLTLGGQAAETKTMSYGDVVARLYDVKRLATMPEPGEKSGNFSSWDRGARYTEATGRYENRFANADGGGFMDRKGTMMELDGPGVIWRIWSAKPEKGAVSVTVAHVQGQGSALWRQDTHPSCRDDP